MSAYKLCLLFNKTHMETDMQLQEEIKEKYNVQNRL